MSRSTIRMKGTLSFAAMVLTVMASASVQSPVHGQDPRQMERLDRGVVAIGQANGRVFLSWRLFGTDPEAIAFNVYRDDTRINDQPITGATCYIDDSATAASRYCIRAVVNGIEGEPSPAVTAWSQPYLEIPLQTPDGYQPNDASVGDLNGDGQYEIVIHQCGSGRDNSQSGRTDAPVFEAYELDGTRLWRIELGTNIREGAHYTQFLVYDFDGDGRAEFACKTADGTIDGQGTVIGDADADYVNDRGFIVSGPEYLTIFEGQTGRALATQRYEPQRHPTAGDNPTDEEMIEVWGDANGNRMDRFLAGVAYLDGRRPSLIMCRGYYTGRGDTGRTVVAAWNWQDAKLTKVWTFDTYDGTSGNETYRGQGYHNLSIADVDKDGKDEIIYGACAIDDDGTGLYSTGLGHGDALHVSDIDPTRPGLEVWGIHENPRHNNGANLRDAATGEVIFGLALSDPGRGLSIDIDPGHKGYECWANNSDGLYNCKGQKISDSKPSSCNMAVWWDGDLLRELLDGSSSGGGRPREAMSGGIQRSGDRQEDARGTRGARQQGNREDRLSQEAQANRRGGREGQVSTERLQAMRRTRGARGGGRVGVIDKWDPAAGSTSRLVNGGFFACVTNNGSKANASLCADILGDWREEVLWNANDGKALRIFSTTIPTTHRIYTLMHDPVYRLSVAWQNVAYNQPAHTGFYLGDGMSTPPRPNIELVGASSD